MSASAGAISSLSATANTAGDASMSSLFNFEDASLVDSSLFDGEQWDFDGIDTLFDDFGEIDLSQHQPGEDDDEEDAPPRRRGHRQSDRHNNMASRAWSGAHHDGVAPQLIQTPPDLVAWRERLFDGRQWPVVLTPEEKEQYWPWAENIWVHNGTRAFSPRKNTVMQSYICRRGQKQAESSKAGGLLSSSSSDEKVTRDKPVFQSDHCPMRMEVTEHYEPCEPGDVGAQTQYDYKKRPFTVRVVSFAFDFAPVAKNCSHNHDLHASDLKKVPTPLMEQLGQKVTKDGLKPGDLSGRLTAQYQQLLDAGGAKVTIREIRNASRGFLQANPDARYAGGRLSEKLQVSEAMDWLESKGYLTEYFDLDRSPSDHNPTRALLFAKQDRLDELARYGHITIMDSTHKTNFLEWKLFTLMVRDKFGTFRACAHFLSPREDGGIISTCLSKIKQWCRGKWTPRYFVVDDSGAEQWAVAHTFRGLLAGELICNILLCHWHYEKTLHEQFKGRPYARTLDHMLKAMKIRKTEGGCRESYEAAVHALPLPQKDVTTANLDQKIKWLNNAWKERLLWASYARNHSCLLMQIKTTSNVECLHSCIKRNVKRIMHAFSLKGTIQHLDNIVEGVERRARRAAHDFTSKIHPTTANNPWMKALPYPAQIMVAEQMAMGVLDASNDDFRELDEPTECGCLFYRQYQLLCRHIFAHHLLFDNLRQPEFDAWCDGWKENGFELYFKTERVAVAQKLEEAGHLPSGQHRRAAQFKELVASLRDRYWSLEEEYADNNDLGDALISKWLRGLQVVNRSDEAHRESISQLLREVATHRVVPVPPQRPVLSYTPIDRDHTLSSYFPEQGLFVSQEVASSQAPAPSQTTKRPRTSTVDE